MRPESEEKDATAPKSMRGQSKAAQIANRLMEKQTENPKRVNLSDCKEYMLVLGPNSYGSANCTHQIMMSFVRKVFIDREMPKEAKTVRIAVFYCRKAFASCVVSLKPYNRILWDTFQLVCRNERKPFVPTCVSCSNDTEFQDIIVALEAILQSEQDKKAGEKVHVFRTVVNKLED